MNEFGEKSAVLTWLVPKSKAHLKSIQTLTDFDMSQFELGPSEDYPRALDCMDFVHRISDNNERFRSMNKYQNSLLNHKHRVSDLASLNDSSLKLITNKYYSASRKHETIIERDFTTF